MASNVLDTLVGDILPHVHIKKIIVEDWDGSSQAGLNDGPGIPYLHTITVQMELYQRKDSLLKSSWLADIDLNLEEEGVTSLFDFFKLNFATVQSSTSIRKLRKSNPTSALKSNQSVYLHKQSDISDQDYWPAAFKGRESGMGVSSAYGDPFARKWSVPVHLGALAGLTQSGFDGNSSVLHDAKIREEIYNGDVYYAIPYQTKFNWRPVMELSQVAEYDASGENLAASIKKKNEKLIGDVSRLVTSGELSAYNLGFVAYMSLKLDDALGLPANSVYRDVVNLEGTISTEVIMANGVPVDTREAFVDPNGKEWSGAVHYHGPENPVEGYQGYMVGLKHRPGENQPKLTVIEKPNVLISDMTDPIQQKVPNEMFSIDKSGNVVVTGEDSTSNIGPSYANAKEIFDLINEPIQVQYQKNTVKDIFKNDKDNDTEFSGLYVSRDSSNNARGMFFIDFRELLLNNSQYMQYIRPQIRKSLGVVSEALLKSRIINLSLYRRRINPHIMEKGYKAFAVNTSYEHPPELIGTLQDNDSFKTAFTSYEKSTTSFRETKIDTEKSNFTRYFAFSDSDISLLGSGYYQYEVELEFFDGTAIVMQELSDNLKSLKVEIDDYGRLASSSEQKQVAQSETLQKIKGSKKSTSVTTNKYMYVPYYDNNYKSYRTEFSKLAHEQFQKNGSHVWTRTAEAMVIYFTLFSSKKLSTDLLGQSKVGKKILKMLMPGPVINGSPDEIALVSRILNNSIKSLDKILYQKSSKKQYNSNIFQSIVKTDDPKNEFDYKMPSYSTIKEKHSYDHPREIVRASRASSFYADYLSTNNEPLFSSYSGPRVISKQTFKKRCYLELLKFSPLALNQFAVHGTDPESAPFGGAIPRLIQGQARRDADNFTMDNLSKTMFSYLCPSLISLASNVENEASFNFRYSTFDLKAEEVLLGNLQPAYTNIISRRGRNNSLLNTMLLTIGNYAKNLQDVRYAEQVDAFIIPPDIALRLPGPPSQSHNNLVQSEAYKSFFSKHNITIHDTSAHTKIFGDGLVKEGGALGYSHTPSVDEFPLRSEYFTDSGVQPRSFFSKIITSKEQTYLKVPKGQIQPYDYSVNLPNIFKFKYVRDDFESANIDVKFLNGTFFNMLAASNESQTSELNAFKFFNFNMVVKIEKLSGHGLAGVGASAAIEEKWQLLTESDLVGEERLLCKMSYYDSSLLSGIELPILDQYFILSPNSNEETVPIMLPSVLLGPLVDSTLADDILYFESQNIDKLNEMMTILEKGKTKISPSSLKLPSLTGPVLDQISSAVVPGQTQTPTAQDVTLPSQTQTPGEAPSSPSPGGTVTGGGGGYGGGGGGSY
tara:strand:+ start:3193 stop:7191 length:3999 start_codon:yes stop_codon:yes gene_type:complete